MMRSTSIALADGYMPFILYQLSFCKIDKALGQYHVPNDKPMLPFPQTILLKKKTI